MKRLTPQEKKALSYERDRRNTYGEAPHAARKSIPLRKALRNRANRHRQNQQLRYSGPAPAAPLADEFESEMYRRRPRAWKKDADSPLGEVVARKIEWRALLHERGGLTPGRQMFIYDSGSGKLVPVDSNTPIHE